jgi:hypothetical protein
MRHTRSTVLRTVPTLMALALLVLGCGSTPAARATHAGPGGSPGHSPRRLSAPTTSAVAGLGSDPAVVGLVLSGRGATLSLPLRPTDKAYGADCHALIDPGFSGKCAVIGGAPGTLAGVVEEETAALEGRPGAGPGPAKTPAVQERDLVWRRHGHNWALALRRVFTNTGVATQLWTADVQAPGAPGLVFVTPSAGRGFGHELDIVGRAGKVNLYRFLGEGFVVAPRPGELVAYVPGWTEQRPVEGAYDQTLIGYASGSWRVVSQQYVPDAAAQAQHHGAFRGATATPAS